MLHAKKSTFSLIFLIVVGLSQSFGQLTLSDTLTRSEMVGTLFGAGVTVSNLTFTCDTTVAVWEFDGSVTTLGLNRGILLATGTAQNAIGPNTQAGTFIGLGAPGYGPLTALAGVGTFDACVVEFDVVPLCDSIGIQYVFASEEYNEFVGSINDVFAFFISGPGITAPAPGQNIALIPGTATPITINNVNNGNSIAGVPPTGPCTNCAYFTDNTGGAFIEYDAYTVPLRAEAAVTACETYHITLAIADASDDFFDSGVFLEAGGIGCITPTLELTAVNSTAIGSNVAVEGCVNEGLFNFTLPLPLPDTTTFRYTIGGTATAGLDYIAFADSFVMPAGQLTYTLPITVFADNIVEGVETIEIYYVDSSLCASQIYRDTAVLEVWDQPIVPDLTDVQFCSESPTVIGFIPQGGQDYTWSPGTGLTSTTISNPILTMSHVGTQPDTNVYYLTTTAVQGFCIWVDSLEAVTYPANFADYQADTVCLGIPTSFVAQANFGTLTTWDWSFGDGLSGSINNPQHIYNSPGSYSSQLMTINNFGCRDTLQRAVYVDSLPVVNFLVDPVCHGTPNQFVLSSGTGASYLYDFGDGNTSTEVAPSYQYADPGIYSALLVATTEQGCVDSSRRDVEVYQNPVADFEAVNECFETAIQFTNLSVMGTDPTLTYNWLLGDGSSTADQNPSYLYGEFGIKNVTLAVTDNNGCTDAIEKQIEVYPLPSAEFVIDNTCAEDAVLFNNQSSVPGNSEVVSYEWRFGDGNESRTKIPQNIYPTPGTYTVFLKVVTDHNCPDSISKDIDIYPLPQPEFRSVNACAFDEAYFFNESTIIDSLFEDRILDWTWNWADGTSSGSIMDPVHVYSEAGTYQVTLTTTSDKGCERDITHGVYIWPIPETPLALHDTVCFSDQAILLAIEGDHTEELNWFYSATGEDRFHSGNTYLTPPVTFNTVYYVEGISDRGCIGPRVPMHSVLYHEADGEIVMSDDAVDIPNAIVNFNISGTIQAESYSWSFGDGSQSNDAEPTHEYGIPGIYEVHSTLLDRFGCEYKLDDLVEVKQLIAVHVPSAFTPNGDGFNDEFYLATQLIRQLDFQVFNRWGQKVYETDNPDFKWNGTDLEGLPISEGVYIYRIHAQDLNGELVQQSGTITVLR